MARPSGAQTAVVTAPATSATSATIATAASAGAARIIVNDSAAILYLRFGAAAASATDYSIALAATGGTYTAPDNAYAGTITGILASGTGIARVTSW